MHFYNSTYSPMYIRISYYTLVIITTVHCDLSYVCTIDLVFNVSIKFENMEKKTNSYSMEIADNT